MTARVTVIIPLFNSAPTIGETLQSLRAQTMTDWEAIIVNDGSTDRGPSAAEALTAGDSRFRMVHQANRGLAGARNTGLRHATAEYVHFLDADDWIYPRGLELLVNTASASGGAAFGAYDCRDAAGRPLGVVCGRAPATVGIDELLEHNRFASHSNVIRRELLAQCQFDESLPMVEDYDLWLRLAARGTRWHRVDEVVASYRLRPASLSKDFTKMEATVERVMCGAYARARAERASADASDERRARVSRLSRLMFRAMSAASQGTETTPAQTQRNVDCSTQRDGQAQTAELAAAGFWGVVFGLGVSPDPLHEFGRVWFPRLLRWWWGELPRADLSPEIYRPLFAQYAAHVVAPESIAHEIVARVGNAPIAVIGAGTNGNTLVRAVIDRMGNERAARVLCMDDKPDALARTAQRWGGAIQPHALGLPIPSTHRIVITPDNDGQLARFFHADPGVLRWNQVRDQLAAPRVEAMLELAKSVGVTRLEREAHRQHATPPNSARSLS